MKYSVGEGFLLKYHIVSHHIHFNGLNEATGLVSWTLWNNLNNYPRYILANFDHLSTKRLNKNFENESKPQSLCAIMFSVD